jgi:hypothetical protein
MMNLNSDVTLRAQEKLAAIAEKKTASVTDQIRGVYDSMMGNQGNLNAGAYGMGGAALGGLAGSHFGTPGAIGGAALGGMMGYGGANAINTQGQMDQGADMALMGGMGQGMQMGDQIDQQQNQMLGQQQDMIGQIMSYLSGGGQQEQAPQPGMDPQMGMGGIGQGGGSMESTDPSMNGIGQGSRQGTGMRGGNNQKLSSVSIDNLAEAIAKKLVHGN